MNELDRAIDMLNDILRRKINSPASYILQASPYVTEEDQPILEAIAALGETARLHAEEAVQRILALEGVPTGGSYETSVADANYLSVRYLLGQLLARLEQELHLVEQYRDRCSVLEAKDFFNMVLDDDLVHRGRLLTLKAELEARRPAHVTHLP